MLLCIIVSYASTSLIFMGDVYLDHAQSDYSGIAGHSPLPRDTTTFVNGYAVVTLATGIIGQCIVATACIRSTVSDPTWSSNPIDTAAACATTAAYPGFPTAVSAASRTKSSRPYQRPPSSNRPSLTRHTTKSASFSTPSGSPSSYSCFGRCARRRNPPPQTS